MKQTNDQNHCDQCPNCGRGGCMIRHPRTSRLAPLYHCEGKKPNNDQMKRIMQKAADEANEMQAETVAKAKLKEEFEDMFLGGVPDAEKAFVRLSVTDIYKFLDSIEQALATREQEAKIKGAEELFLLIDERFESFKIDKYIGEVLSEYRDRIKTK